MFLLISVDGLSRVLGLETLLVHGESVRISVRSGGSVKYIINKNLYLSAYAGEGHYNDMDMLEIGRGLKPEEEEVHFGMWCIMSSPFVDRM